MKIGFLSICTMLFALYGTDCFAKESVKDKIANWKRGESADIDESKQDEDFEQRMKEARIRKGSVNRLRSRFNMDDDQESEAKEQDDEDVELRTQDDEDAGSYKNNRKYAWDRRSRDFTNEKRRIFEGKNVDSSSSDDDSVVSNRRRFFEENDDKRADGDRTEFNRRRRFSEDELDKVKSRGAVSENRKKFESVEAEVNGSVKETKVDSTKQKPVNSKRKKSLKKQVKRKKKSKRK